MSLYGSLWFLPVYVAASMRAYIYGYLLIVPTCELVRPPTSGRPTCELIWLLMTVHPRKRGESTWRKPRPMYCAFQFLFRAPSLTIPTLMLLKNSWAGLGSPDIVAEAFPTLESPIVYVGPPFPIACSYPTCSDFPGCITNICPSLPTPDCPWGTWL